MANIKLSFDAKDDKGNNLGDYEMFVDLTSTPQDPSTIALAAPQGYKVLGVKLYQATESGGKVTPSPVKNDDITRLRQGNWSTVFDGTLPSGFTFNSTTSTLTDSGASPGIFEYLIWLESTGSPGTYDFADPGIRNH